MAKDKTYALKFISYALAKMGLVEDATKLAKVEAGKELETLKEIQQIVKKSIEACAAKKEVISQLHQLEKENKIKAGSNIIAKACTAPDELFIDLKKSLGNILESLDKIEDLEKAKDEKKVKDVEKPKVKKEVKEEESDDDAPWSYSPKNLQRMIDSGQVWRMEGSMGRAAMDAIKQGHVILGPKAYRDYWGNRVPAHHEVKPGTHGSPEYAREKTGYVHPKHAEKQIAQPKKEMAKPEKKAFSTKDKK